MTRARDLLVVKNKNSSTLAVGRRQENLEHQSLLVLRQRLIIIINRLEEPDEVEVAAPTRRRSRRGTVIGIYSRLQVSLVSYPP